jgi:hypothetical protein
LRTQEYFREEVNERILISRGVFSNALGDADRRSAVTNVKRRHLLPEGLGYCLPPVISLPSAIIVEGEFVSPRHSSCVSHPAICSFTIDSEVVR